jgi:hypothetical protein
MSEPFWTPLGGQPVDYEGAWNPATQYAPGDVVRYLGVDYLAVNPSLGSTPPNAATPTPTPLPATPIDAATLAAAVSLASPLTDEFRVALDAKWLSVGAALSAIDANQTALDCLYTLTASAQGMLAVRYQPIPAFPFTAVTKLTWAAGGHANNRMGGIILLPASPTTASPCIYNGSVGSGTPNWNTIRYTSLTAFGAHVAAISSSTPPYLPMWIRTVLTNATTLYADYSSDGYRWRRLVDNYTIPFTIANVGLGSSSEGGGQAESLFDYFRVTP